MSKTALALMVLGFLGVPQDKPAPPNLIVILADDVGYGDLGCYGATKVETPHLDRLAAAGLRFSDGHAASATCTPTRYGLLTGEYPWRKQGTGILPGDAALIIEPGRPTLPSVLKSAGYATGVVGKWHLGLGAGFINWNGEIKPGPLEIGFDSAFIMPATGDRVPCVYVEDRKVVGLDPADPIRVSYQGKVGDEPTGRENPELLKMKLSKGHDSTIVNGISRIGWMSGGKAARWTDEDMADVFAKKAVEFVEKNRERPFFLYFATHDIHVPRVPHPRFVGKSECGTRGDALEQLDDTVGRLLAALDRLKLAENTLVVFSSDNGPVLDDGYADGAVKDLNGHAPAGPLKGQKYSLYEAGTRVPFIARWPARIKPGTSEALVCQVDLLHSFAALVGVKLPPAAGPDSWNVLPALLGESKEGREHLIEHAGGTALRKGAWKYIPPPAGRKGPGELYNLLTDLGETKNLAASNPDRALEMARMLEDLRKRERTR
jgi:arylsulfatase A-like enzyme